MRTLKIAVIVMGVLIVLGTAGLIVGIARRSMAPQTAASAPPATLASVLDEPAGTHISRIVYMQDRLAVQLQGGGMDRIVLLDSRTGSVVGRISLAR